MGTVAVLLPFAAALCAVNAAAMPRAVVLASHAGWNATNATAAVQSTIDSGFHKRLSFVHEIMASH